MDLLQIVRIVFRRFYVFLPIAVLAAVLATSASGRIAPEYTASASAILVGPGEVSDSSSGENVPINPYLSFSSSLATTSQVLKLAVEAPETRRLVITEGLSREYFVFVENRNPVLNISATSGDPVVARDTVLRVIELMSEDLAGRQEQVAAPANSLISMTVLATPGTPASDDRASSRVRLMILGAGLLGAVAAAVAFDTVAAVRRRRADHPVEEGRSSVRGPADLTGQPDAGNTEGSAASETSADGGSTSSQRPRSTV